MYREEKVNMYNKITDVEKVKSNHFLVETFNDFKFLVKSVNSVGNYLEILASRTNVEFDLKSIDKLAIQLCSSKGDVVEVYEYKVKYLSKVPVGLDYTENKDVINVKFIFEILGGIDE